MEQKKSTDFNIYYLNFSKVYEIAMMINNVICTKIEKEHTENFEKQHGYTSSFSAQGTKIFLDGIKASISANTTETTASSAKVIESMDVKTTKSLLLRRIIEQCKTSGRLNSHKEGDLVKLDNVKLKLLNEDNLRQFMILRRDALKGVRFEGMEVNNLIGSILQDYAYLLKGTVSFDNGEVDELIIKIPMEIQSEFENKYSINDLRIGHVSIVGIFKGRVPEDFVTSNTFTYFQEAGNKKKQETSQTAKIIKSNSGPIEASVYPTSQEESYFIDVLAIIQNVSFTLEELPTIRARAHWWNKIRQWLRKRGRK